MTDATKENKRTTPVMIYTSMRLTWGKLVHPDGIRPQVWLKNTVIPEYFILLGAESLLFGGVKPARMTFPEAHVPTKKILAIHLLPPAEYIPDYDETEPYREMREVTAICDIFRFDGVVRIATIAGLTASLHNFRDPFRSIYAVSITVPIAPSIKPLSVPHALIRTEEIQYNVSP